MPSILSVFALLTIGIGQSSVEGDCVFNSLQTYCRCSLSNPNALLSIFACTSANIFEFRDGSFDERFTVLAESMEMLEPLMNLPLARVTFSNSILSEGFLVEFVKAAYRIHIKELVFENCAFVGSASWQALVGSPPQLVSLQFKNVSSTPLSGRTTDISSLSNWMGTMKELTLAKCQVSHIPSDIGTHFRVLLYLDLSNNPLQEKGISQTFCNGLYPTLEVLRLRSSHLTSLGEICNTLAQLDNLTDLDLSQNNFSQLSSSYAACEELSSIRILNLSDTGMTCVNISFPSNIEILDLSRNRLQALDISLYRLKTVVLSNNALNALPSPEIFPSLEVLSVDGNMIDQIHKYQLQAFKHLTVLSAGQNPYTCSCSSLMEMKDLVKSELEMLGWPAGYICDTPAVHKGTPMNDVNLTAFECHKPLLVGLICVLVLVVSIAGILCWVKTRCGLKPPTSDSGVGDQNVHLSHNG
ncbi:monocyte differentiation antigen CD14 [Lissotriton helveticus]